MMRPGVYASFALEKDLYGDGVPAGTKGKVIKGRAEGRPASVARNRGVHSRSRDIEGGGCLFAVVGDEGAEGEEGCPKAAFGVGVVEGRGESGEPESTRALRPSEPRALGGFQERHLSERVIT